MVAAGFTGRYFVCFITDKDNNVIIKKKLNHIDDLSYTKKSPNNILYELYGVRTFHT